MVAAEKIGNKRYEIKDLIKELKKNFNGVEKSIFGKCKYGWNIGMAERSNKIFIFRFL